MSASLLDFVAVPLPFLMGIHYDLLSAALSNSTTSGNELDLIDLDFWYYSICLYLITFAFSYSCLELDFTVTVEFGYFIVVDVQL